MKNLRSLAIPLLPLLAMTPGAASSSSGLAALKSLDYRYFVAGGTCAAISHGITCPIDVVKTRIQADPQKYPRGLLSAAGDIIRTDGAGVLLGGLGPTVVGYGIEGAMKFGVYEVMKPVFKAMFAATTEGSSTAVAYLMASLVAGAVAAMLLCPMESTRIRIVTDPAYANKGLLTGLPKMVREEGLWSSFATGLWAMLAKQVPYTLGKQVSFDIFAGMLYAFFRSLQESIKLVDGQIKWFVSIGAAFMASLVACIFSQPGDMILTETYRPTTATADAATKIKRGSSKNAANASSKAFVDVVRTIYAAGGLPAFFTGTGARIVHVGVIITSQLVIYDIVKQLLGLPATGSH